MDSICDRGRRAKPAAVRREKVIRFEPSANYLRLSRCCAFIRSRMILLASKRGYFRHSNRQRQIENFISGAIG
jgi:hypothetical protein